MTVEPSTPSASETDSDTSPVTTGQPRRSVGKNIGALMSSQVVTWTLTTALVWVVPRYLGAEAFGSLRVAMSLWMIAGVIATFGTSTLLTVEVAKDRDTFRSILVNSVKLRFWIGAIVAPVVLLVLLLGPYDRQTQEVGIIVGIGGVLTLCVTAIESALFGLQEMGHPSRIRVITKVFATVTTITVVLLGGRLLPVATVNVVTFALSLFLLVRVARRVSTGSNATSKFAGKALLFASVPFFAAEATRVVYQQIDTVVMSVLVDSTAIGYYAAADTLFGSLLFVPVIVTTAMFPAIAELHERAPEQVPPLLRRSFNTLLVVSVPIGLGTIIVAPSFINLLYGGEFDGAAPVLAVYGVVVILSSQTILLGRFALATGRARFWSSLMICATVLSVPLDIVLVPWTDQRFDNGAIGGALAYVVTEGLLMTVGIAVLGRSLLTSAAFTRLLRCAIAGAAMMLASWPFREEFFAIPGAIGVATYLVAILVMRTLEPHEVDAVTKARAKIVRRRAKSGAE